MKFRSGIYIVPTHRWYIERTVWLIAGTLLLICTALAAFDQPAWGFADHHALAVASIIVALTGFCIVGNVLKAPWLYADARSKRGDTGESGISCRPTPGTSSAGSTWRSEST